MNKKRHLINPHRVDSDLGIRNALYKLTGRQSRQGATQRMAGKVKMQGAWVPAFASNALQSGQQPRVVLIRAVGSIEPWSLVEKRKECVSRSIISPQVHATMDHHSPTKSTCDKDNEEQCRAQKTHCIYLSPLWTRRWPPHRPFHPLARRFGRWIVVMACSSG